MKVSDCTPGTPVWYYPSMVDRSLRFAGVIGPDAPRCLGGSWVVRLVDIEPAYAAWKGQPRIGVAAAALTCLGLRIILRSASRVDVYAAIDGERAYQARRWNEDTTSSGGRHSVTEFLVYARSYVNEALEHVSRNADPGATDFALHSLRKIAALAVAALEQNGVRSRETKAAA